MLCLVSVAVIALVGKTTLNDPGADSLLQTSSSAASQLEPECVWSYGGENGPDNWGSICHKKYPVCASGRKQSPINIKTARMAQGPAQTTLGWKIPEDAWNKYVLGGKGDYLEEFNGHTFEVVHVDATFPFGGVTYKLQQFHMHTMSEHTVDGERYDMEMHFVHTAHDASSYKDHGVLVVAVLFKISDTIGSPHWLTQLAAAVPSLSPGIARQAIPVDFMQIAQSVMVGTLPVTAKFKDFKPNYNNFMAYTGSFTTPPCTEGVQWLVLSNPIYAAQSDITAFKSLEGANFRDVQPLNGRIVTKRYCGLSCN